MAHIGSWGTPDFGITEWLQKTFLPQAPTTAQGGSSLGVSTGTQPFNPSKFVSPTAEQIKTARTPGATSSVGGQVQGLSTYNPSSNINVGGGQGNQGGWEEEQRRIAEEQARIDLENAMSEYGKYEEEAQAQIGTLGKEKENLLSEYGLQREKATTQAEKAKSEAKEGTTSATRKALSTSQDVIRKNRNILRALGILSSSAAGEMLNRPTEEFARTSGDLQLALRKREDEVNNWLTERGKEIDLAVNQVNNKFTDLVAGIQRDIRYNGEQRANAVRAAAAAKQQALNEIRVQAQGYQTAANQYTANMLQSIAQMQLYQNPQADISGILSQAINIGSGGQYSGGQVGITQSEAERKRLSGY